MRAKFQNLRFAYLVPVYNEEPIVEGTVEFLLEELAPFPGSQIVLVENGSCDGSREIVQRLAGVHGDLRVHSFSVPKKGLGIAYQYGLREVLSWNEPYWIVFGAADLPFGLSDIVSFSRALERDPAIQVATGSKLHEESNVRRTLARQVMTWSYWQCRKRLLCMKTRDCQGSVIIHTQAMHLLEPLVEAIDYFFTTELIYLAEQLGLRVKEVPVQYIGEKRKSTIRPFYHSVEMLRHIFKLRRRAHASLNQISAHSNAIA